MSHEHEQEHEPEVLYEEQPPDLSAKNIGRYFRTRIPTLKPPPWQEKKHLVNPLPALRQITGRQWLFILVGMSGWLMDSIDYFVLPLTQTEVAKTFDKEVSDVSWSITLVLMLRSVGAVIFGIAGDRWGRKWPFIINCALFIVIEICSGLAQTFEQFLGIRAIFGIAMGGIYGNASATALEDTPVAARGFISGLFQECYALGYLLCVAFNRAITPNVGWRPLFYFAGSLGVIPIVFRLCLPETDAFQEQRAREAEDGKKDGKVFYQQAKAALRIHWLMFCYLIVLMAIFNFSSHGSQDLLPTMLDKQLGFSADASAVTNSIANLGALAGGIIMGHCSEFVGRRLMIMIAAVIGGAIVYPWGFVKQRAGLNAAVFFMQFCVQGAWGVIPIHISELSAPRFRSFIVGVSYQLGNLASSAASTIESKIGERYPILDANGKPKEGMYEYGRVMAILMGAVFAAMLLVSFLGPEKRDASFVSNNVIQGHKKEDLEKKLSLDHVESAVENTSTAR